MDKWKVSASDIKNWTEKNKRLSEETLPLLIRKLITASVIPDEIDIPSGDSIFTPGWDGFVKTDTKHSYIPEGTTCWEMGTNSKVGPKATSDYEKRTKETSQESRSKTIYIFVTTRNWGNKTKWTEERKEKKEWRDIRSYNASDLEAWLEMTPSVHVWFANLLGKRFEDVFDHEQAWLSWSSVTTPAISSDLVLCSRKNSSKEMIQLLGRDPQVVRLVGDSYSECFGFALACLKLKPELSTKVLIAESQTSWNNLASKTGGLILIPNLKTVPDNISLAIKNGHWVILPLNRLEHNTESSIKLERISKEEAEPLIVNMGVDKEQAEQIIAETKGFLMPILRNKRLNNGVPVVPSWVKEEKFAIVAMALLFLGKWESLCSGDQEIVCSITGIDSYEDVEQRLHILSQHDDPPCRKNNNRWIAISRLDMWSFLGSHITVNQFEKYSSSFQSALLSVNPMRDLEQKMYLMVKGEKEKFSNIMLSGMAEFLPIMSCLGYDVVRNFGTYSLESRIYVIVRDIFEAMDTPEKWLNIEPHFLHFAEAAPDAFLSALENDLEREKPLVITLFQKENTGLFGGCHHSHLLWGLETISWNLEFFTRVVHVLAKLTEFDPGGNYANRPKNTLADFFRAWYPQTHATVDQRIDVLKTLQENHSQVLWDLLASVYQGQNFASPIASPRYRSWKDGYQEGVTNIECVDFCIKGLDVLILNLRECFSIKKAIFLLGLLSRMPNNKQSELLLIFNQLDSLPLLESRELALEIGKEISLCGQNEKRQENMSETIIQGLQDLKKSLLENDLIGKHLHFFSQDFEMSLYRQTSNHKEATRLARSEQKDRLGEIISKGTVEDVVQLSSLASNSFVIGALLAEHQSLDYVIKLLKTILPENQPHTLSLLSGILGFLSTQDFIVEDIFLDTLSNESTTDCNKFLVCLPFSSRTLNLVNQLPEERQTLYWESCKPWLPNIENNELVQLAFRRLLISRRQHTALEQANFCLHRNTKLDASLLAEILEHVAYNQTIESPFSNMRYDVLQLLEAIQIEKGIPEERMLQLEWVYLKFYEHYSENSKLPPTIFNKIKSEPHFYMEIISYAFNADPKIEGEFSQLQPEFLQQQAELAYTALNLISEIPFDITKDHETSFKLGLEWIRKVQEKAKTLNRAGITDDQIGKLLSLSPMGTDNIWPHEVVRKIIEKVGNESILSGLSCGYYNRHNGVVMQMSRSIQTGNQKEANIFRHNAKQLAFTFPKTSRLLYRMADSFGRHSTLFLEDEI